MQAPRVVPPAARPSELALAGWFALGAPVGLLLMIFQPPLSILLAIGLPLVAVGRAWRAEGGAPRAAYSLGAFGAGLLLVDIVLLVPLFFS